MVVEDQYIFHSLIIPGAKREGGSVGSRIEFE
jgi:hypothetical protein